MFGIRVVPLNFRRQRESMPFGRRQLVCEQGGTEGERPHAFPAPAAESRRQREPQSAQGWLPGSAASRLVTLGFSSSDQRPRLRLHLRSAEVGGSTRVAPCGGRSRSQRRLSRCSGSDDRSLPQRARTPRRIWVSLWLRMKGLSRFFTILCCRGEARVSRRRGAGSRRRVPSLAAAPFLQAGEAGPV